jgi:hypothetical protein
MRRPSVTHSRTITAVAIGIGATQGPCWAHPARLQDAIKQSKSSHPSPTPASHFLAPEHPIHDAQSIDDSASLRAQLTGKRAPTPCHDRAGGSRQADPSSNKGFCTRSAYMRSSIEGCTTTHHRTTPSLATPSGDSPPTVCMQREPIAERASWSAPSLYVSRSCGVPRDGASGASLCEDIRRG